VAGGGDAGAGGRACREQNASAINEIYSGTAQQALATAISLISTNSYTYISFVLAQACYIQNHFLRDSITLVRMVHQLGVGQDRKLGYTSTVRAGFEVSSYAES
jgi:hypothetical protein